MMTEGHTERQKFKTKEAAQDYASSWITQVRKKEYTIYSQDNWWYVEWKV